MNAAMEGMVPEPLTTLEEGYYLRNFLLVLQTALERAEPLLSTLERAQLDQIFRLPEPALRLYARLFNRKGPYFRPSKLAYPELESLEDTLDRLQADGLLERWTDASLTPQSWIVDRLERSPTLLTGPPDEALPPWYDWIGAPPPGCLELQFAVRCFPIAELRLLMPGKASLSREARVTALLSLPPLEAAERLLSLDSLVRLRAGALVERLTRLFFLNSHQDHTTLVTTDLRRTRYPQYSLWVMRPVFPTREDFEQWLEVQSLRQLLWTPFPDTTWPIALFETARTRFFRATRPIGAGHLERFSPWYGYGRVALEALRTLEPALSLHDAIHGYQQLLDLDLPPPFRGTAWKRLLILQERSEGGASALPLCQSALLDAGLTAGERLELTRKWQTLSRRNLPRVPRRTKGAAPSEEPALPYREVVFRFPRVSGMEPGKRALFLDAAGQPSTVEQIALASYRQLGAEGLYTENTFFTTLAVLLFWDIVFGPSPDVFLSPFQTAPLDLFTPYFIRSRTAALEARYLELQQGAGPALLERHYSTWFGMAAHGVSWSEYSLEELKTGVERTGGPRLAALLQYLLERYRERSHGLPDLLLWRPEGEGGSDLSPSEGAVLPARSVWFAEVKSTRDRLSYEQLAWMEALQERDIHVDLCRVLDAE